MIKKISLPAIILSFIGVTILCIVFVFSLKFYNSSRYSDESYVEQEVMKYLEKRYNEKFVVIYNRGMGPAYNYVQLFGYPQNNNAGKYRFEIQGYYNEWGKLDYYDSYIMVKLTDDYEAYLNPIIDEYFDDYKFYVEFQSEWLMNNLPADTTLENLWDLRPNVDFPLPTIYIYLAPDEKRDDGINKEMCENLRQSRVRGLVDIWNLTDEDRYKKLRRNDWRDYHTYKDFDNTTTIFIYDNRIEVEE